MKSLKHLKLLSLILALVLSLSSCAIPYDKVFASNPAEKTTEYPTTQAPTQAQTTTPQQSTEAVTTRSAETTAPQIPQGSFDLSAIPPYAGSAYVRINNNLPYFTEAELTTQSYERYSDLDSLGRCGIAMACIGQDLMPTEDRESISSVKPSGWIQAQYNGEYLYNRCHLIGFQLTGENANEKNLITGTRYLNANSGMIPFENMVADYIKETGNHVMYRVTPVFEGNNLLASGVCLEAYSVEDNGDGICFNVYIYNVQPGIIIDYATGASRLASDTTTTGSITEATSPSEITSVYILNTSTKKFHYSSCYSADNIAPKNKETYTGSRAKLIEDGYSPCGHCDP